MRKFEKVVSGAIVAAISFVVVSSVSTIARADDSQQATSMQVAIGSVSRSEAKKIVRAYLKEQGKRNYRVGDTNRDGDFWIVSVTNIQGTPVREYRVNQATGELGNDA